MINLQEAFDKAVKGLLEQGVKAVDAEGLKCVYRGPNGVKCAVGQLIPDDKYDPVFDAENGVALPSADTPQSDKLRAVLGVETQSEANFLSTLQGAHDRSLQDDFVKDFRYYARNVAINYGLNTNALD